MPTDPAQQIYTFRKKVDPALFNPSPILVHELRIEDFHVAMQDVYDFLYDVNRGMEDKSLPRFEETVRGAILSGTISDMLTVSMAKHSRALVKNWYHNGHPDLILNGRFARDSVKDGGLEGVEIKTTSKSGGGVDFHGARAQWAAVFVYEVDEYTEPTVKRAPLRFTEVYLSRVSESDFRRNERKTKVGTPTSSLHADGLAHMRKNWIYIDSTPSPRPSKAPGEQRGAGSRAPRSRRTSG